MRLQVHPAAGPGKRCLDRRYLISYISQLASQKKTPEAEASGVIGTRSVSDVGQQSDLAGTLDGAGQVTLVSGAGTGGTAGQDLAALGQVTAELSGVLVIDAGHLINAESTDRPTLAGTHTLFVSQGDSLLRKTSRKVQ